MNKKKNILICCLIGILYLLIFRGVFSILGTISIIKNNEYLVYTIGYMIIAFLEIFCLFFFNKIKILKFEIKTFFKGIKVRIVFVYY